MPIGTGIVYNTGDLILSQVSSSGTAFLETKIAAATSSLIYFDSTARINSASLNSITVGTASYVSGSNSIVTNFTASNISASGTSSFGYVGIGTTSPIYKLDLQPTSSTMRVGQSLLGAFPANPSVFSFFGHTNLDNLNTAANYALLQESNGNTYLNASSGKTIYFRIANSDKMILNSTGQFGIGTTSPITGYLDVRSNQTKSVAGPTNIAFFGSGDGGNPLGLVLNHESSSGVKMVGLVGTEYGSSGNNIKINETLHVQYSGNVGIGTISPASLLSVQGDINSNYNSSGTSRVWRTFATNHASGNRGAIVLFGMYDGSPAGMNVVNTSSSNASYNSQYLTFLTHEGAVSADERMRITPLGNVGIGTTNPSYLLDVYGSIRSKANTATGTILLGETSGGTSYVAAALIGTPSPAYNPVGKLSIQIPTHGVGTDYGLTEQMSIQVTGADTKSGTIILLPNSGYVGIGTTSPAYLLDVSGSTRHGYRAADNHYFTGSVNISGSLTLNGTFAPTSISASGTSSFGYVGIGTTSAVQDRLTVYNSSAATDYTASTFSGGTGYFDNKGGISIYNPNTTTNNFSALDFYIDQTNYSNVGAARIICKTGARSTGGTFDTSLIFLTHNQAGTWNQTVIDNSGNVGIGTTSPSAKLTIVDNTNGGTINLVGRTSDDTAAINFRATGDGSTYAYVAPDTNEFRLYHNDGFMSFYPGGSEKVRITSTGNVGIGTTNPVNKLQVNGNVSGSSFTSSISNAVGFLGTASWAQNVVSASYATTAQTANALNASNTYTVAGLTSAYVDVTGAGTIPTTGIYRPSTKTLGLSADGTLIFKISNVSSPATSSIETGNFIVSGSVGIGTTSPSAKLELYNGNFKISDGNRIIFGASDPQIYGNSGVLTFRTNSSDKMYLDANGNLGIGTSSPGAKLDVNGDVYISPNTAGKNTFILSTNASNDARLLMKSDTTTKVDIQANGTSYFNGGNVGIGTTSPNAKLQISGSSANLLTVGTLTNDWGGVVAIGTFDGNGIILSKVNTTNDTNRVLTIMRDDTNGATIAGYTPTGTSTSIGYFIRANASSYFNGGNVGIGTTSPGALLEISGSSNSALLNIKSPISGAIVYVSGSGAVGINTSNIGAYTLQVNGSFAATTKSFVIDHPTKAGKRLIYGSLESPYHGIRLTGRDTIKDGKCKVELPDYMYKLILHDSINIQLTGIKCNKTLYVDEINIPENYFTIAYDKGVFESYKDYDFFWDFTAIRADVPELNTEL